MKRTSAALWIGLAYFLVASSWIVVTDLYLSQDSAASVTLPLRVGILKGLVFVGLTAILIFLLIRYGMKQVLRTEERMRTVITCMSDAVFVLDLESRIIEANPAVRMIFPVRYPLMKMSFPKLLRDLKLKRSDGSALRWEDSDFVRLRKGESIRDLPLQMEMETQIVALSLSASPVSEDPDSETPPALYVVTVRDMTEFRRLERMRDEFLSVAAHELKTPLAVIKANEQMLMRFGGSWDRGRAESVLQIVDRQCDRMNRLIQELLEISRLRLHRFELKWQNVDIADLTSKIVEKARPLSMNHVLGMEYLGSGPFFIEADPVRVEQVVLNLLDNAIKYSPAGGEIRVTLKRVDGSAVLGVQDQGIGIPQAKRSRIFERYHRAHRDSGAEYSGMGIGLNLCREIVERHGGKISFVSEEGKGSRFDVSLPIRRSGEVELARSA